MNKGFQNETKGFKKTIFGYLIAIATFAVTLIIALLLQYYSIKINLTILIAITLIVPAWYGGRGPGLLVVFLLELVTILTNSRPPETGLANWLFSHFSIIFFCVVVVLLVSSRRKSEASLREQRELWQVTLASIGDAVIVTDTEGQIRFINPMAEALTGWTTTEAAGRPLTEVFKIINETTRQPLENPITKVLRKEAIVELDYETILVARDGTEIPIADSNAPIRAERGEIIGVVLAFRDISEHKQLIEKEKHLQQSQKMEAIGTLTGGVAHDFNNLLTAIIGNTQLALMKAPGDSPVHRNLKEVEEAGMRAAGLTKQLLVFSRRQRLERRIVNLNETINEISKMLQRIIGEDVEFKTRFADDLANVLADPAQIEQVVMNLAVNARDAMPGGGRLTIATSNIELDESYCRLYPYVKPGRYVQIAVSDTGVGMDETTMAHIFEPFFTTKEIGKGTGLGLSTAYGIVKQHEGNINVYSETGHGTTFKVFLPMASETAEKKTADAVKPELRGGRETILIAEDEAVLRNLACDILEGFGYSVLLAENGAKAVALYAENRDKIDLLLFDVVMPELGGAGAYEQISTRTGEPPPVIFMTGYSSELVENRFVKRNNLLDSATAIIIQKPYSIDGLVRTVRDTLDKKPTLRPR
jgi:two-component system, cell cycle sensor histidine kinase and response regulator CckA